jgi:hypothetical protein
MPGATVVMSVVISGGILFGPFYEPLRSKVKDHLS